MPDIAHAVSALVQNLTHYDETPFARAKRVLTYLKCTIDDALYMRVQRS